MYLGLFLDKRSEDVLRDCFENTLDNKLHLTIIHTPKETKIETPMDLKHVGISQTYFDLVIDTAAIDKFGKDKDVWVLKMEDTLHNYLSNLRIQTENWFYRNHYSFSNDFLFNPHITLTKDEVLKIKKPLPKVLVFNKIEWVL